MFRRCARSRPRAEDLVAEMPSAPRSTPCTGPPTRAGRDRGVSWGRCRRAVTPARHAGPDVPAPLAIFSEIRLLGGAIAPPRVDQRRGPSRRRFRLHRRRPLRPAAEALQAATAAVVAWSPVDLRRLLNLLARHAERIGRSGTRLARPSWRAVRDRCRSTGLFGLVWRSAALFSAPTSRHPRLSPGRVTRPLVSTSHATSRAVSASSPRRRVGASTAGAVASSA